MTIEKSNASIESIVDYLNDESRSGITFGIDNMPSGSYAPYRSQIAQGVDGKLYEWGAYVTSNLSGNRSNATKGFNMVNMDYTSGVKDYTRIGYETYILMNNGDFYTYGANSRGGCGTGNRNRVYVPTRTLTGVSELIATSNLSVDQNDHMTYIKKNDGTFWGWGNASNFYGRFGDGTANSSDSPKKLASTPDNSPIVKIWNISCAYGGTYALTQAGNLYGCGYNGYGCMGVGDSTNNNSWRKITGFTNSLIKDIQGGRAYHDGDTNSQSSTVFLLTDGNVYTCGDNTWGQLGTTTTNTGDVHTPTRVTSSIDSIHCSSGGALSVFCIKTNGKVIRWGHNAYGQMAVGNKNSVFKPFTSKVGVSSTSSETQLLISHGAHVQQYFTSVVVMSGPTTNRSLFVAGHNGSGVLADGTTTDRTDWTPMDFWETENIKQILVTNNEGGDKNTFIIMNDGKMYGSGYGTYFCVDGIMDSNTTATNSYMKRLC